MYHICLQAALITRLTASTVCVVEKAGSVIKQVNSFAIIFLIDLIINLWSFGIFVKSGFYFFKVGMKNRRVSCR